MIRRLFLAAGFAIGLGGLAWLVRSLPGTPDTPLISMAMQTRTPTALRFSWRLVNSKSWQIASDVAEDVAVTDSREGNRGACMPGMIEVAGKMLTDPPNLGVNDISTVEEKQKTTCTKWINKDYPERCASFDRAKWLSMSEQFETTPMHYCIDRFEYPNQKGQFPIILVSFPEAQDLCEQDGKRLCSETEWTFACEGEEAMPYPYGYERDAEACVVDKQWRPFNAVAMFPRDGDAARAEMDKLWQGVASGSQPRCRSSFGAYDMTGNVDEWTRATRNGRASILKGGYWGPVRTRCRPSTRTHDERHTFYQQGFRCCADVGDAAPAERTRSLDPSFAPLPRELK